MSKVLSAVAWPYANGPRHIGHIAGFGVPSDVFSRYMRMAGHDVLMVSGTDEHGTPILVAADKAGVSAKQLADESNRVIVQDLASLGLSYDLFTRTTTRNHYAVVQEMFRTVHDNGYMVEQTTQGAVSPSTGRTLPDRYIEGTCPICGYGEARGDQCDNCGNQLDPTDLLDPRSRINGETPKFIQTQHFFLDLPALAKALGEWLDGREASGTWRPNVIRFSQNILKDIRPRAMTRDIDWGIPIPLDGWREHESVLKIGQVIGRDKYAAAFEPGRPEATEERVVTDHAIGGMGLRGVEIDDADAAAGLEHGACVIDELPPIGDHRQGIGKRDKVDRGVGRAPGRGVGLDDFDVVPAIAANTRPGDVEHGFRKIDNPNRAKRLKGRPDLFEAPAGAAAEIHPRALVRQGQKGKHFTAALQQADAKIIVDL